MKSASSALTALLNSSQTFVMADLYTITLVGGFVVRYTDAGSDLTVGGNVFSSSGPIITRTRTRTVIGVEVDSLNLTLTAQSQHLLNGASWLAAIRAGALDGGRVLLERVFMPSWGDTSAGSLILFGGRVAGVELGRTEAKITVKSDLELLNIKMPRNLYQPSCPNALFDAGCGLAKSAWAVSGSVTTGGDKRVIGASALNQGGGWFDQGTIAFSSGVNAGVTRSVRAYVPGSVTLALPLVSPCSAGDAFTIYPGCDKTQATCSAKFSNLPNFRGFPFVPVPESVV